MSIASFMFGFVGGVSLEYNTSKKEMRRREERETKRLRTIAEMAHHSIDGEAMP